MGKPLYSASSVVVWQVAFLLLSIAVTGCGESDLPTACCGEARGARAEETDIARHLFLASQRRPGNSLASRRAAAEKLAGLPEAEPWIIIMLLDPTALDDPSGVSVQTADPIIRDALLPAETAVIARLLESLPPSTSCQVLWAVAAHLDNEDQGQYSEKGPFWRYAECVTPPVRDLAKAALVRATGEDYGFGTAAWKQAILSRGKAAEPSDVAVSDLE